MSAFRTQSFICLLSVSTSILFTETSYSQKSETAPNHRTSLPNIQFDTELSKDEDIARVQTALNNAAQKAVHRIQSNRGRQVGEEPNQEARADFHMGLKIDLKNDPAIQRSLYKFGTDSQARDKIEKMADEALIRAAVNNFMNGDGSSNNSTWKNMDPKKRAEHFNRHIKQYGFDPETAEFKSKFSHTISETARKWLNKES